MTNSIVCGNKHFIEGVRIQSSQNERNNVVSALVEIIDHDKTSRISGVRGEDSIEEIISSYVFRFVPGNEDGCVVFAQQLKVCDWSRGN